MTTPVVFADKIAATVRDIADHHPHTHITPNTDRGYTAVVYIHHGQPNCIIGHALNQLEVIDADLENLWHHNRLSIADLLDHYDIDGDPHDVGWLRWVQHFQDAGSCWSSAVSKADGWVARGVSWAQREAA